MKKVLFILVPVFLEIFQVSAENKVIFTLHDKPNSSYLLSIAEPLDGRYNNKIETFKQTITDSSNVEFTFRKEYPAIIAVEVTGRRFNIIMSPNTTVYTDIYPQISTNDWIVFHGDNAVGQKLYNDNRLGEWLQTPQKIFKENEKKYHVIGIQIKNYVNSVIHTIDSLKYLEKISDSFAEVIKKECSLGIYENLMMYYNYHFYAKRDELSISDSIAIRSSQDEIFSSLPPFASDILAYTEGSIYLGSYADVAYHYIDISTEKRYIPVFNNDGRIGLFPDNLQKPALGGEIVGQYFYNLNGFDRTKAIAYFREKYPDSEYLPVIDKIVKRYKQLQADSSKEKTQVNIKAITKKDIILENETNTSSYDGAVHIDTSGIVAHINTLNELHNTFFKGKKIFIDIWAPWCKPCIEEFVYKAQLDSLLKLHNIIPVLLSLGPKMLEKHWIQLVYDNKLAGYNFVVNDSLRNDIFRRAIVNHSNPFTTMSTPTSILIPHYIYMDEHGDIIEKDAPRPSEIEKLVDLFKEK